MKLFHRFQNPLAGIRADRVIAIDYPRDGGDGNARSRSNIIYGDDRTTPE
jgi:hypothetical protein